MTGRSAGLAQTMTRHGRSNLVDFVLRLLWLAPGFVCLFVVNFWLGLALTIAGVLLAMQTRWSFEQAQRERDEPGFAADLVDHYVEQGYRVNGADQRRVAEEQK
jgi:hypothetical protein